MVSGTEANRLVKTKIALVTITLTLVCIPTKGIAEPPAEALNKLTFSYYHFSSGKDGADINLRHTFKSSTAWIGGYHESQGFNQFGLGFDYDYRNDWLTLLRWRSGLSIGFLGGP